MKHLPTILLGAATLALMGCEDAPLSPTPVDLRTPVPEPEPEPRPAPESGPGTDIFDFPFRALSLSGYWGTNRNLVQPWEDRGATGEVAPLEFIEWLHGLHVNWVLLSVALHYDDSMDSTVSRETGRDRIIPTWRNESLRQVEFPALAVAAPDERRQVQQ